MDEMHAEYGMGGEASIQGDVYSFGILILEMFTGKRPTHETLTDGFNLHNYVKLAFPGNLVDIVDPILLQNNCDNHHREEMDVEDGICSVKESERQMMMMGAEMQKCLMSVFQIGLACSMESPKERINMKIVIQELHRIKSELLDTCAHRGRADTKQFHRPSCSQAFK